MKQENYNEKAGRPIKNFGEKLSVHKNFMMTESEDKVFMALCKKMDLSESRMIRQILFNISKPIELKRG